MNKTDKKFLDLFTDWEWRLNNLYWITTKEGERVKFKMNWAQQELFRDMHYLNIVLKARQLGFSTFIQIFMLDAALFNANTVCGVIAQTRDAASGIFQRNVKYAYDNLAPEIQQSIQATTDQAQMLKFSNGSSIEVGTSLRSGTFQYLHISEFGKICATRPDRAREIVTGALNTIAAGQICFVESTAEGREGAFFDMCELARQQKRQGAKLSPLDFKFHFFPFWKEPTYSIDADVVIDEHMAEYFDKLEVEEGISLNDGQKAWYVKKAAVQQEDMKREYPATPDEAFEASVEGAYYAKQFYKIDEDNRICDLPIIPGLPVHSRWDLGMNDFMAIWLFQISGPWHHFLFYYENSGEGLEHYVAWLQRLQSDHQLVYGEHLWPHDGNVRILDEKGRKRTEVMRDLGYKVKVIKRSPTISSGIEAARRELAVSKFDQKRCAAGVRHMRAYSKDWDETNGVWRDKPKKSEHNHGADAYRTGSEAREIGFKQPIIVYPKEHISNHVV